MTVEIFVRIVSTVFVEIEKKAQNGCFFGHFGLILAMFITTQSYDFDIFAHAGAPSGAE